MGYWPVALAGYGSNCSLSHSQQSTDKKNSYVVVIAPLLVPLPVRDADSCPFWLPDYILTYSAWSFYSTSQGFIHVPKKPGGLKPELIDVDLVIGMLILFFNDLDLQVHVICPLGKYLFIFIHLMGKDLGRLSANEIKKQINWK